MRVQPNPSPVGRTSRVNHQPLWTRTLDWARKTGKKTENTGDRTGALFDVRQENQPPLHRPVTKTIEK